jgi:hypothetical protein
MQICALKFVADTPNLSKQLKIKRTIVRYSMNRIFFRAMTLAVIERSSEVSPYDCNQ